MGGDFDNERTDRQYRTCVMFFSLYYSTLSTLSLSFLYCIFFFRIRSTFNNEIANPELNPGGMKLLWRSAAKRSVVTWWWSSDLGVHCLF